MMGTTPAQYRTLIFIARYVSDHGFAPCVGEIREHLELASNSGVVRILKALEERGLIRRIPWRNRAIEVISWPPEVEIKPSAVQSLGDEALSALRRAVQAEDARRRTLAAIARADDILGR